MKLSNTCRFKDYENENLEFDNNLDDSLSSTHLDPKIRDNKKVDDYYRLLRRSINDDIDEESIFGNNKVDLASKYNQQPISKTNPIASRMQNQLPMASNNPQPTNSAITITSVQITKLFTEFKALRNDFQDLDAKYQLQSNEIGAMNSFFRENFQEVIDILKKKKRSEGPPEVVKILKF